MISFAFTSISHLNQGIESSAFQALDALHQHYQLDVRGLAENREWAER